MAYGGYVVQTKDGPAWDLGAISYHLTSYRSHERTADYLEAYAGVVTRHASFHLYYAPDNDRLGAKTLYADLGATVRPTPNLRLFSHVGALAPISGTGGRRVRYDVQAGVARQIGNAELSIAWTHVTQAAVYADGDRESRDAIALSAAYFF
jgi:hypothetical protein